MKRITLFTIIIILLVGILTGCSSNKEDGHPYIRYQHCIFTYCTYNQNIEIPDGYILNQGHSYDVVKTEGGYDIVLHFIKE